MIDGRTIPIGAFLLACGIALFMLFVQVNIWVIVLVLVAWIGSFWLFEPKWAGGNPNKNDAEGDGVQLTRTGMGDLIEHSALPVLMLDGNRIILANVAARDMLGAHIIGQDARVAFRHPIAVDLLTRRRGGMAVVQGLTGPKSNWQITSQPIDKRYRLVELINRTAEVDVSRAHTDFVANASHELRTPIASIIGYMETLEDGGDTIAPERVKKFYSTVLREARRLHTLVDDLLSLSRVEAEKHDQPREKLKFGPIIAQAARDGAGEDKLDRIEVSLPDQDMLIRGDRNQLEQLVRNLVDNALKYGSHEHEVHISLVASERDMAILTVRDHGEGIAPEHLPHLTRRFYRTDPGRSRAAGGTGLGLAIVKHIVERHRGRLDITSTVGDGTKVTVQIPLSS